MQLTDNTILITGGATGIGRGLAEAFAKLGNQVIVAGRRQDKLDEATRANPGIRALRLDIGDAASIGTFAQQLLQAHPALNVVINNAGMAQIESLREGENVALAEATVTTNLLGPIRLTAALLPHLLRQPRAAVLNVSSGLAMVPLAHSATYSATKAALHSYTMSLRYQLAGTATEVIEIIPPYVQTELGGPDQAKDPRAMPLTAFIEETMDILGRPGVEEATVGACEPLRFAAERGKLAETFKGLNDNFHS